MNALAPIYTNRCPDKYRHLSPQEECRIRSARIGSKPERPGGLPNMMRMDASYNSVESRQDRIITAIRAGNNTRATLCRAIQCSKWVDRTVAALVIAGRVVARRDCRIVQYEVAA